MSWEKKERRLVWLLFWLVNGLGEGSYMYYLNFPPGSTGFPDGSVLKNLPANAGAAGDMGSIPRLGRSPRGGNGNPLQCSCLGNLMDRGDWQATNHRVTESHA